MTTSEFPIVGIGASAGGIPAFRAFFSELPADCGMAFVLILHLPGGRKSMLPEIVGRWTTMRVIEASDGTRLEQNCVYVPPAHTLVALKDGHLSVRSAQAEDEILFRPIDRFFDSLGRVLRDRAVGIVLSGTGSDGALGLKAIKEWGGFTIAQGHDESGPQYGEMPDGAIATGAVDLVAPVVAMPGHLLKLRQSRLTTLPSPTESARRVEVLRLQICDTIRAQVGHDFSGYRDKTFLRRVQRRMQVVGVSSLEEYVAHLQGDHHEVVALFRDLLIRVTSFFRDEETFALFEQHMIPRIFAGKQADAAVRVWVPGCATGEEAYSLAMLLREHLDRVSGAPKVHIFATDIDEAAIDTARLGRYPSTLLEGLAASRRERFFKPSQGTYVVAREIRDMCTFSQHNLLRDPPFSRMDLVSCRNLLIYLDAALQMSVIPVFHYSLVPHGVLLLGGSESVSRHEHLFEPVDRSARIFQKRDVKSPPLKLPGGSFDLSAYLKAEKSGNSRDVSARTPGDTRSGSRMQHRPAEQPEMHAQVVAAGGLRGALATLWRGLFPKQGQLQSTLVNAQEELHSLMEEHQTALEELRSANEELHSVNEEMQSTNEELETSKEELQSMNEELNMVNSRLTEKIEELDAANSDLRNLFESTQIATVFLDRHLVIRSFTPAIATLYNLIPSDQGRPLSDIVTKFRYDELRDDVAHVLNTLQPLERQISREDRLAHFIMRILPYREPDSSVTGVLVTFVDVTTIVQAEQKLREADMRKDVFLATLSHELRNPLAPIRTAATVLELPGLAPEERQRAQAILSRQVTHLTALLDDLLDISRISRGAVVLKKEYVSIQSVLASAVETVQPELTAKQHMLRIDVPPETITLEADAVRLIQVFSNLLSNAAKYTPKRGQISVTCVLDATSLRVTVSDTGIGLAANVLSQVFQMFARVETAVGRGEDGLGIGLALAKGLAQLHGGDIQAQSAGLGFGSTFTVVLPATSVVPAQSAVDAPSPVSALPADCKILVADDSVDGAESLKMLLTLSGHDVTVAHDGQEAYELAKQVRPDVVVMDIGMPGLTGYQVAQQIRQEAWGTRMMLVAMTGWGQEKDKRLALEVGFDHHLTKPIDIGQLRQLILANYS